MSSRVGDRIGHAWLASFFASPILERHRQRLVALEVGEVVDLSRPGAAAELASRPAGSADTVVSVLTLCAVPDLDATLGHVRRVLRPGGRFLYLEHVPDWPGARRGTDLVGPAWRWLGGGCDARRNVPEAVRRAGLRMRELDRFTVPTLAVPLRGCVAGMATKLDGASA